MPCQIHPLPHEIERSKLNSEAKRLIDWLNRKLGNTELDPTGKLCALIREMGDDKFLELMVEYINESEARQLIGWWEKHKEYDQKYGR